METAGMVALIPDQPGRFSVLMETAGMVALIPDQPGRFSVAGGLPPGEIHCTLVYLGDDVTGWPPELHAAVLSAAVRVAAQFAPVTDRVMGHAVWNADGGPAGDKQPYTVYELQGDDGLAWLRQETVSTCRDELGAMLPEQHDPWKPHVSAGPGVAPELLTAMGPVTFSVLRVALGEETTDYPLAGYRSADPAPSPVIAGGDMPETVAPTETPDVTVNPDTGQLDLHWPCLVIEGQATGDNRLIPYGSLGHRALPLSVAGQTRRGAGHDGAEVFGHLTKLVRHEGPTRISKETGEPFPEGTAVWEGWGVGDPDSEPGKLALAGHLLGNSADLADATSDQELGEDGQPKVTITKAMIAGTTLVPVPAFADGYVEVNGQVREPSTAVAPLAASVLGAWSVVDGVLDSDGYEVLASPPMSKRERAMKKGQALPPLEEGGPPRFPIETAADLANAIRAVGRAKGDHDATRKMIIGVAKKLGMADKIPDNWQADGSLKATTASAAPDLCPISYFTDPGLTELTPLTRDPRDPRHVYGHIADWNRTHIGYNGAPVYAARSRADLRYFNTGAWPALAADGTERTVAVGHLTIGTKPGDGHAPLHYDMAQTREHYDNAATTWAYVQAGEDAFGIWVNGQVDPEVPETTVRRALAHPPSIDQRPIDGHLELAGALSVVVAGIPVPRARVASGEVLALTAAGWVPPAAGNTDVLAEHIATLAAEKVMAALTAAGWVPGAVPLAEDSGVLDGYRLEMARLDALEELGLPFAPSHRGGA